MVTIRRVIEETINEEDLGAFLADQARTLPVRGCNIVPREGEATFEPVPIKRGDFVYLRETEYTVQGIYAGSPIYVLATVPEAGVFWGIYLRDAEKSVGGSFFNGAQVALERAKPRTLSAVNPASPVRLAAESNFARQFAGQTEG